MVNRFTTFVMAISPTFWEKEVTGGHPKKEEKADAYPSQAREPVISLSVMARFKPLEAIAVVSPMVSAADTKKIIATEKIAPGWNSGM